MSEKAQMPREASFASDLLQTGAAGYAAAVAGLLLERHPETAARFGSAAFRSWRSHLAQRIQQLSGALLVGEPGLFAADVVWSRTSFGSREVPIEDLRASLECLRDTLAEELPEGARELAARYLEQALEALAAAPAEAADAVPPKEEDALALRFLEAALSGQRRRAIELVLDAVDGGLSIETAYTEVLPTAQRTVGDLWHRGDVSVPQEHVVTATARDVMTLLAHRAPRAAPRDRNALVTVAPGNAHELAARALADLLEIDGWEAVYLGGSLPPSDLAVALEQFEADLLCFSVALSTQLRGARASIETARSTKPDLEILVGGSILAPAPQVWRTLGANAGAPTLGQAVDTAALLFADR